MEKYLTIYHDVLAKLKEGYWEDAEMLPSEHTLASDYKASRETIRKALNLLVQNGYIQKVRGKGSMIIKQNMFDFPVSGIMSFKELSQKLQFQSETIVHEHAVVKADRFLQKKLQVPFEHPILQVTRIRKIDGEKVILDKDYFNCDIVPALPKAVCQDSIYAYLENELGLEISYAQKEITVVTSSEEDGALLDLDGHSNIVLIKSKVHLEDTTLFQYTESRHRPDKFKFTEFARRM